jgi:hypothetical protein
MTQQRRDPWPKVYSLHAPEVECIGKGKAAKPHEFGCKVAVATTNRRTAARQFVLHIEALHGSPYDGHTLEPCRRGRAGLDRHHRRAVLRRQGIPRPRRRSVQSLEVRQKDSHRHHPKKTPP